ncbi:MAG TPA: carboxypeptidase-like regulatory domain-containing protein [Burkholderiaceae bacterium]|nr:carboxypeptidase-like regulatory domain-containing protein [Burkholderiaceae bacterium]HYB49507.1 carboxypeptidase-like regulatory domain-containing protein [Burkholderiaceae bacterium]
MHAKTALKWAPCVVAGLATLAAPAFAATMQLPPEQHEGSVSYLTGGIGEGQAKLFEHAIAKHRLAIELLQHSGKYEEFTADAMIRITDQHGHMVLNARAGGPFMLVDLPPGRYSIEATLKNVTLKKPETFVTKGQVARATFEFPAHTD